MRMTPPTAVTCLITVMAALLIGAGTASAMPLSARPDHAAAQPAAIAAATPGAPLADGTGSAGGPGGSGGSAGAGSGGSAGGGLLGLIKSVLTWLGL